jgi:hypothetical protein
VSEYDREASKMRRHWHTSDCRAMRKKYGKPSPNIKRVCVAYRSMILRSFNFLHTLHEAAH